MICVDWRHRVLDEILDFSRWNVIVEHPTDVVHHRKMERCASRGILVEDTGSANGVWVEDSDIRGRGPVRVQPDQQVHFGLLKTWYTS